MNREEAIVYVIKKIMEEKPDNLHIAVTALRGPQPDPITGLMPCGCGGEAEEVFDGFSFDGDGMECNDYLIRCKKCGMRSPTIQTWNEKAQEIWNTAMGRKDA